MLRASAVLALSAIAACAQQSQPAISATPATVTFSFQIGNTTLPAAQSVAVKHSGTSTPLDFVVTPPASAPWLIVTPLSGKTGGSLSLRVNPTSLLAGTYAGVVQIDAAGAAAPALLNVTLVVRNPPPVMSATPNSMAFTFDTDQAAPPAAQGLAVSTSGEPVSFTAAVANATWLTIDKDIGITVAGSPVSITASVNTSGLTPGTYSGRITLASTNAANKTLAITVTLTVNPGTAVIASIWPNAAPIGSDDTIITVRGRHLFKSSTVKAGATTLSATWIGATVLLATIPKSALAVQGTLAVTVTNAPKPPSNAAVFTVTPPGPQIQAVVNAASFATSMPTPEIAPGEILSIFGSGLGPAALLVAVPSGGAYPVTLGTPPVSVEFELVPGSGMWTAAPIIFAQANQINCVAPFALTTGTGRGLRVKYNTLPSSVFAFDAVAAAPGIFTIDASGRGQAAVLNYNATTQAYSINSGANAAAKGSIIVIYLTGAGVTNPMPDVEGQVVPLTGTVPVVAGAVSVTIGGDGASVQSATSVPGSIAGLVQLNVTVPASLKAAKDHPLVVTVAGRSTAGLTTVAVK